jgi:hypothetical protein
MRDTGQAQYQGTLKDLVQEASQALLALNAQRLEELALSCQALNRSLRTDAPEVRLRIKVEARECAAGMDAFARMLAVTRSNLTVMSSQRSPHAGRLEYSEAQARGRGDLESARAAGVMSGRGEGEVADGND